MITRHELHENGQTEKSGIGKAGQKSHQRGLGPELAQTARKQQLHQPAAHERYAESAKNIRPLCQILGRTQRGGTEHEARHGDIEHKLIERRRAAARDQAQPVRKDAGKQQQRDRKQHKQN